MFANKVVIVTGGSAGIGAATAECFAKEGASVAIAARNETKLKNVAERCEKLGAKVLIIKADVSKDDDAKRIVNQTIETFGKLDVLVNNAGVLKCTNVTDSNALQVYDEVINTNLRSTVLITSLAAPYLKDTKGNIINVSSIAGMNSVFEGGSFYCLSKAGMDQFTKSSALELAPFGIRVNSINPGPVETDMLDVYHNRENAEGSLLELAPLKRVSESAEVGDLIVYVASNKARGVTGSCYVIDNGVLLA